MTERFKEVRESVFIKWPAKAVAILVVLGFAIGLVDATLESAVYN